MEKIEEAPCNLHRKNLADPISIGNRVKSARMLSGLTRTSFAKKSNISAATLRAWEEPPKERHGLTSKGAKRLIVALNLCGIYCSESWLLFGHGESPKPIDMIGQSPIDDKNNSTLWTEEEAILKDINSFLQNNKNAIVIIVPDDIMCPPFSAGDYVGGRKKTIDQIKSLIGLNCIIETNHSILIREIIELNGNYISVKGTSSSFQDKDNIDINEINSAAEIIWHRWRENQPD